MFKPKNCESSSMVQPEMSQKPTGEQSQPNEVKQQAKPVSVVSSENKKEENWGYIITLGIAAGLFYLIGGNKTPLAIETKK